MQQRESLEYSCSECNSIVSQNDKVCLKCGADLQEEIYPVKYNKTKHRIIFYLLIHPLIYILAGLITGFVLMFIFNAIDTFTNSNHYGFGDLGSIMIFVPVFTSSFVFAFFFIEREKGIRITVGSSLAFSTLIFIGLVNSNQLNPLGIAIAFILLAEVSYNIFNKRNFKILIPALVLLLIWFVKFRTGDLPSELLVKDFRNIIEKEQINYNEVISNTNMYSKEYDSSIDYYLFTDTDTLIYTLNYMKVEENFFSAPEWKLVNWEKTSWMENFSHY